MRRRAGLGRRHGGSATAGGLKEGGREGWRGEGQEVEGDEEKFVEGTEPEEHVLHLLASD